jgi:hypothetical protein
VSQTQRGVTQTGEDRAAAARCAHADGVINSDARERYKKQSRYIYEYRS